jgi:hypothetical protein
MRKSVIFLGPSLSHDEARLLLDADYRPPVRRGDVTTAVGDGYATIGIVDGEFGQSLAVSVAEIRDALRAGVRVFGASSMGALRAAECDGLGMRGIGVVFSWYKDGIIHADDEVALLFDQDTGRAATTPLVNVRWAASRARVALGWDAAIERALIAHARALPFRARSYANLIRACGETRLAESARALAKFVRENPHAVDVKRRDALALLKELAEA